MKNNPNLLESYQQELGSCFRKIGVTSQDNLYITGNVSKLGRISIGQEGTIFSPAASMNLCNTEIPFDLEKTPSHGMGPLAEYFRTLPESVRSLHPFWSICGSGVHARMLKNVSRHAYGVGSPWSIFLELNARQINLGLHPSKAVTLIHHIETIVGVPYRYTKEFAHPITDGNSVKEEQFYMSVRYLNSSIRKRILLNEHFFEALNRQGLLFETEHSSGLKIWAFSMRDFYDIAIPFFIEDIYTYLEEPPKERPYSL